jgi:hypothetical protein
MDGWVAENVETLGIVVDEGAAQEVLAHLYPTPSNRLPPHLDPSWTPSQRTLVTAKGGARVSVADFFRYFPVLGIDEWPRARNLNSIRAGAERMMMIWIAAEEIHQGRRSFSTAAEARIAAKVNQFLGQAFLDAKTDPGPVDSARAEEVFTSHPEHFEMPESVSISAIGVTERSQADELYALIQSGASFDAAAAKAAELDPNAYYAPTTPFIPRGQFPDTDAVLFSLEPGQVAPPVRVPKGFQIYRLVQKRESRPLRRVELSEETLLERATEVLRHELREGALQRLRSSFPVERNEDVLRRQLGQDR